MGAVRSRHAHQSYRSISGLQQGMVLLLSSKAMPFGDQSPSERDTYYISRRSSLRILFGVGYVEYDVRLSHDVTPSKLSEDTPDICLPLWFCQFGFGLVTMSTRLISYLDSEIYLYYFQLNTILFTFSIDFKSYSIY